MSFFLVGIVLWSLVTLSILLVMVGLWKKSWKFMAWSGITLLPPMLFIFGGGEGSWFQVCISLPLFLLVISYWMKQQQMQNL